MASVRSGDHLQKGPRSRRRWATAPAGGRASILGNHYSTVAGYVTANVNLWPLPLVIVTSPDVFESLTAQQAALREASTAAVPDALQASRDEDDEPVPAL